jgi:CheY-like chemotaxis protein
MALTSLAVRVDADSSDILTPILEEMGILLVNCGDFSEAAARLATDAFDLVLIDFSDEATGLQFTTNIRKTAHNKKAQIIALINSQNNNVRSLFSAGCNFVLYKPLTKETAHDSLRAARGLLRREKRSSKRIRLNKKAAIAYSNVENAPATLLDLSDSGVKIQSEKPVPPKCKVYFQFSLPGQPSTVRMSGEVIWQDSIGRVGLRFADVPQSSRKILNEWLKANSVLENEPAPAAQAQESGPQPATRRFGLGLLHASLSDRRIKARHACQLGAELYKIGSQVPNRCNISDISSEGCYVESTAPFPVSTQLEIVVKVKNIKLHVEGKVQTMHPGFGMGIEFALKTPQQKEHVRQLIEYASQWGISV